MSLNDNLLNSQNRTENTINCYEYEQYDSVWCKVIYRNELKQKNEGDNGLIQACIEEVYLNYTSESFHYNFQWEKDNWILSTQSEHKKIIDQMIKYAFIFIEEERQEAIKERNIWLSNFKINGMKDYEKASEQLKKEINLKNHYQYSFINEKEEPKLGFTKHQELKENFLNNLFAKDDVRFYYNRDLEETTSSLTQKNRNSVPAIMGMDNEKIALFWFNF